MKVGQLGPAAPAPPRLARYGRGRSSSGCLSRDADGTCIGGVSLTSIAATCLWQRARAERSRRFVRLALFWLAVLARSDVARADLAIETETARVLAPGQYTAGAAFEFQTSPGGAEYAVPTAFEFGGFKNLELMVEPVAFTAIMPRGAGPS